jgi:LCP family protein required for cell wall assembly
MVPKGASHFNFFLLAVFLAGCVSQTPTSTTGPTPALTPATLTATLTPTLVPSLTPTFTPTATFDPLRPWGIFPGPDQTPVTQVPPPITGLSLPDEVRSLVLLGTDSQAPFVSRTDAIQLIVYHPRLSRASLISLPPDMMVYIPGFTMQRLQVAYAVSGWRGLFDTIQYNFGIRPNYYVLVHLDGFVRFIDQTLDGLDVNILQAYPDPKYCGGIPTGVYHMTGDQVLCYIRFRVGNDEADRNRRQQEIFYLILNRMVQSGNLTRLSDLYTAFRETIETNLELPDMLNAIPLVIKLGDASRFSFFHFGEDELKTWQIPDGLSTSVFLPKQKAIQPLLQDALNFIQTPAPLSEAVQTYEAAMTNVPSATITKTPTITLTPSNTLPATLTPSRTYTPSITWTPSNTPTPSDTPTITPTGPTPTPTITPTGPTPTATVTPSPTNTP